jgi:hypothetical protein
MPTNYLITKFKSRNSNVEYHVDPTYQDLYNNSVNVYANKNLMDFICSSTYDIKAVRRADGEEFEVDTSMVAVGDASKKVVNISIQKGLVVLYLFAHHESIFLGDAVKYVEPIPEPTLSDEVKEDFFIDIQYQIIEANPSSIRLPGLLRNRKSQTLPDFLRTFFLTWNNEKDTIFVEDRDIQTAAGKRRSVGDIFMICRYYYPTCTLSEVYDKLLNLLPITMPSGFRTSYCSTINKRVWYFDSTKESAQRDLHKADEYGNKIEKLKTYLH